MQQLEGSSGAKQIGTDTRRAKPSGAQPDINRDSALGRSSADQCGVTLLAGRAVGAPFVGAAAAALLLSELLRVLHGGGLNQLIDFDLLSVDERLVVPNQGNFTQFNPGFVSVQRP